MGRFPSGIGVAHDISIRVKRSKLQATAGHCMQAPCKGIQRQDPLEQPAGISWETKRGKSREAAVLSQGRLGPCTVRPLRSIPSYSLACTAEIALPVSGWAIGKALEACRPWHWSGIVACFQPQLLLPSACEPATVEGFSSGRSSCQTKSSKHGTSACDCKACGL